ncbi:ABC transporter substrate-binding protein [Sinomonas sp. G460-2]|uniref:ABC transporter substrate-binding protein n=1 Tax=Sinomonas sp. G460-2 TaxID=3393464 RepID=UPI0039EF5C46
MRWKKTVLCATVAAGLALAGCSSGAASGSAQAQKNITLGNVLAPATFEARNFNWGNQSVYAQAVYDTLVKISSSGHDLQPSLATSWEYNADKTVLTMKLRDDVTFSDGTHFTADVAAQNLLRFRDGTSPQKPKVADMVDAKAQDKTTLVITLKQANPAFLIYLGQAAGLMESPAQFGKSDVQTKPVGSGPYTLNTSKTVVGTSYVFDKNPTYWDAKNVHYDTLTINVYTDSTSELNALRGKQLNAAAINDPSIVSQVEAAGFKANGQNLNFAGLLLFDRSGKSNPALGNVKVRQAINYAIDADAMLKAVAQGRGVATRQVFPESSVGYDESLNSAYKFDPARAKQLLAEAGYAGGLELTIPTSPLMPKSLWPLLQQQLGDVGIKTKFVDTGQNLIADLQSQKYGLSYFTLQRDANDWMLISNMIAPNGTWNTFKYSDPTVTALLGKIRAGSDADKTAAVKELNKYIVDQAWFDPWYSQTNYFATDGKTAVDLNQGNAWPNLWDIKPKA